MTSSGELTAEAPPIQQPPARKASRRGPLVVLTLAVVVVLEVAVTAYLLLDARSRLEVAADRAQDGAQLVLDGELPAARDAFAEARRAFNRAGRRLAAPPVRVAAFLPVVGPNLDAVTRLADAGADVSDAGAQLTDAVVALPQGMRSFVPVDGALPVAALTQVGPALTSARGLLERAEQTVAPIADYTLAGPVASAYEQFEEQLTPAVDAVAAAEPLVGALPDFLGANGPRRYFFGAATPAELRGATGFIGSWSILTLDQGRLSFTPFAPMDLPDLPPGSVEPPNPDYLTRYGYFGAPTTFKNLTLSPDFPSNAVAMERLWEATQGYRLDGTVVADPFALAALLEVAGPVPVPGGATVDADSVVEFVAHDAYALLEDAEERKRLLGDVATAALAAFLENGLAAQDDGGEQMLETLRTLGQAARNGHLTFHASNPEIQKGFEAAGVAGQLLNPPGDYFSVVIAGTTNSKIDYYLDRELVYDVRLAPDGSADVTATLRLRNDAPTEGLDRYIIGPNVDGVVAGENRVYVSAFLAEGAALQGITVDGAPTQGRLQQELGHPVVDTFDALLSGQGREVVYRIHHPDAWQRDDESGRYVLTLQEQSTIRPTRWTVHVEIPDGTSVVDVTEGLDVNGPRVTMSDEVRGNRQLEVVFAGSAG